MLSIVLRIPQELNYHCTVELRGERCPQEWVIAQIYLRPSTWSSQFKFFLFPTSQRLDLMMLEVLPNLNDSLSL